MDQAFKHSYKDSFLEFSVEAYNDDGEWANLHELIEAMLKVVKCTSDWKQFEFYVVVKSQGKSQGKSQVKSQGKSHDDWKPAPDLA